MLPTKEHSKKTDSSTFSTRGKKNSPPTGAPINVNITGVTAVYIVVLAGTRQPRRRKVTASPNTPLGAKEYKGSMHEAGLC